jgi:NTP pyrophosphatase (non-canonical NTP hydrolase)
MSTPENLLEFQKRQLEHDQQHHQDIYTLPYPERMNHYVLHFSKYVGRLSRDYTDEMRQEQLEKTLADSTIVVFAAANTLNLDLETELEEMFGVEATSIEEWGQELNPTDDSMDSGEVQDWLLNRMATPTGRMSNAMESLDHMEPMNVRNILEEETVEILSGLLIAMDNLNIDLGSILDERWEKIEEESIL